MTGLLNAIIRAGGTTALETEMSEADVAQMFLAGAAVLCCHVVTGPDDDTPLGFQTVVRHAELPPGWCDIATFTRRDPALPGAGRALFSATRERARELGLVTINAAIRADNSGGLAYYGKMGFDTYRTLPAVPLRSGACVDRIFKRYDLG
nr:GNAT family N-acetyltransferase [Ancylobacter gelatini]